MSKVVVIGGGAAGMFAALTAAERGASVTLIEHNEKLGKKIYITGKGRCNLTNASDRQNLISHVVRNQKFMYGAFSRWNAEDTESFFEGSGLRLVTERGNRVFPSSGHASDVTLTLERRLKSSGVRILLNTKALKIIRESGSEGEEIRAVAVKDLKSGETQEIRADACIVATGGRSYPSTGSTGEGYELACGCGHRVTALSPSLVSVHTQETWPALLAGLTLRNVGIVFRAGKKEIYRQPVGELLFTHRGISGPAVLSASSYMTGLMYPDGYEDGGQATRQIAIRIDLKPALSEEELDARILREIAANSRKELIHALRSLFPKALMPVVFEMSGLNRRKRADQMTAVERHNLVRVMKGLELTAGSLGGWNEAVITRGGVDTAGINPSTMESKLVRGLFFAGEVIDVDALTGGYNLQIAWSTGFVAGATASRIPDVYNT